MFFRDQKWARYSFTNHNVLLRSLGETHDIISRADKTLKAFIRSRRQIARGIKVEKKTRRNATPTNKREGEMRATFGDIV